MAITPSAERIGLTVLGLIFAGIGAATLVAATAVKLLTVEDVPYVPEYFIFLAGLFAVIGGKRGVEYVMDQRSTTAITIAQSSGSGAPQRRPTPPVRN